MVQSPCMKILEKIVITTVPKMNSDGCTPYVEVLSGKDFEVLWTNKNSLNLKQYRTGDSAPGQAAMANSLGQQKQQKIVMNVDSDPLLCGDIYFRLMHKGSMKSKLICRFALNTSFIQDNNIYEFTKFTVDPDSKRKDPRIPVDFKVECYFRDFCSKCTPSMAVDELCKRCSSVMKDEIHSWRIIKNILDVRVFGGFKVRITLSAASRTASR